MKRIRVSNVNRLIIGQLNINSLRNKFEYLKAVILGNIDILILSETKLDDSYPTSQLIINGFKKPVRYERNSCGGGILFYVRSDTPSILKKVMFFLKI